MSNVQFGNHHAAAALLPPSQALLEALKAASGSGTAIDLGCGAGTDAFHLLDQGWQVLAIDQDQKALDRLEDRYAGTSLSVKCQVFENLNLQPAQLVNASFALPFCQPEKFDACWQEICRALPAGGIFSGHFFGTKDSWSTRIDMTFHSGAEYVDLFRDFEIIWQTEIERDGKALGGEPKHWHVYHVAARKL